MWKEVLTSAEVARALDLVWSFLEAQGTGVRRGQPSSWVDEDWSPSGGNPGLHSAYGLAQSEAAWYVRGKPRVQDVWAGCFDVRRDELITSFDGVALLRPSGLKQSWATSAGNFHIDGRRGEGGFDPHERAVCQGLVNLLPTAANKAGNVVVPRSHQRYAALALQTEAGLKPDTGDIIKHSPEEIAGAIKVQMFPGDALTWDDRTIHGSGPGVGQGPSEPELERAAVLCSMYPRARTPSGVLKSRQIAIANGFTGGTGGWCGHNPCWETNGNQGGGGSRAPTAEEVESWRAGLNPRFRVGGVTRDHELTEEQMALVQRCSSTKINTCALQHACRERLSTRKQNSRWKQTKSEHLELMKM